MKATQSSTTQIEEESIKRKAEVERLHGEVEKVKGLAKEEEEKRVKAIALLKTVRQKLVKAEKDRDDVVREVQFMKEREKEEALRRRHPRRVPLAPSPCEPSFFPHVWCGQGECVNQGIRIRLRRLHGRELEWKAKCYV